MSHHQLNQGLLNSWPLIEKHLAMPMKVELTFHSKVRMREQCWRDQHINHRLWNIRPWIQEQLVMPIKVEVTVHSKAQMREQCWRDQHINHRVWKSDQRPERQKVFWEVFGCSYWKAAACKTSSVEPTNTADNQFKNPTSCVVKRSACQSVGLILKIGVHFHPQNPSSTNKSPLFMFSDKNFVWILSSPSLLHVPPNTPNLIILIIFYKNKVMTLLMLIFMSSCQFILLQLKWSPQYLVLRLLQITFTGLS